MNAYTTQIRYEKHKGYRVGPDFHRDHFYVVGKYDDLDKDLFFAERNKRGGLRKFKSESAAEMLAKKLNSQK